MHSRSAMRRLVPSSALASLVLASGLVLGPAGHPAVGAPSAQMMTGARALSGPQVRFHDAMRRLWEEHITWTRLAIVTFADGSPGFDATARRLLRNQQDIGDAIKPFYGRHAGNRLATLLHAHIAIAVQLLEAAKAGDQAAEADARKRWYHNADQVADFLSSLDPHVWPRATMRSMMKTHLDQTLAEAVDELTGHYGRSITEYAHIQHHILAMADSLSGGIMEQFPGRFGR